MPVGGKSAYSIDLDINTKPLDAALQLMDKLRSAVDEIGDKKISKAFDELNKAVNIKPKVDTRALDEAAKLMDKLRSAVDEIGDKKISKAFDKLTEQVSKYNEKINKSPGLLNKLFAPFRKLRSAVDSYNKGLDGSGSRLKKILNLMRLIVLTKIAAPVLDKATNFSDNANINRMDAASMNSSVKNIRAIDYAFDLHGSKFDRNQAGQMQNNFSDVSKYHAFAALGISSPELEALKNKDGADAFMETLSRISQRIESFGGFDNLGAKSALKGFVEELGLQWEELKGLNKNGRLKKISQDYETRKKEDKRDYTAFEKFEQIKKKFIMALDDIWEGIVSKLMPAINKLSTAVLKVFRKLADSVNEKTLENLMASFEKVGNWISEKIQNIDVGAALKSVVDWFAKIPDYLKSFWEMLKTLVGGLANILNKIPGFGMSNAQHARIKMMTDDNYAITAMREANKKVTERGTLGGASQMETLNKLYNERGVSSATNEAMKSTINSLTEAVGFDNDSKEAVSARNKLQNVLMSKPLADARRRGEKVEISMAWDSSGKELVVVGKDSKGNPLLRQTIMRLQD